MDAYGGAVWSISCVVHPAASAIAPLTTIAAARADFRVAITRFVSAPGASRGRRWFSGCSLIDY